MIKKIILFFLILIFIGIFFIFYFKKTNKTEGNYLTLNNYNFYIPEFIDNKIENDIIFLNHRVPSFEHYDFCDFVGDKPIKNTFTDFSVSIEFTDLIINDALVKYGGIFLKEYIDIQGKIKEEPGFLEKINFKNFSGYKLTMGVEGCGLEQYFLETEGGILVIKKDFIPELTELNLEKTRFEKLEGVIEKEKAEEIFSEIIENIKTK